MSNLKVFAVRDTKLGVWMQPFQLQHTGQALRFFEDLSNDGQSIMSKHPSDFNLYEIATFDDASGAYQNLEHQVNLACASDLKKSQ